MGTLASIPPAVARLLEEAAGEPLENLQRTDDEDAGGLGPVDASITASTADNITAGSPRQTAGGAALDDAGRRDRIATIEARLDRFAVAFGALCELVCEPLGVTEEDLSRSIERIAEEHRRR